MARSLWLLLLWTAVCSAADTTPTPPMPQMGGASPIPDVSGGRTAIISLKDVRGDPKFGGLPFPEPKYGARFKKAPNDPILIGDSDGWMANLEAYRAGVKSADEILVNANIQLSSLKGTAFEQFTLLGYIPEGTVPKGPWSVVGRLFAKPPGELVYLKEWDFGLDGGGIVMFDEQLNTKVGHARASIMVTKDGNTTQTQVRWVTGTRQIEILAVCRLTQGCADPDEWRDIAGTLPEASVSPAFKYKYQ